VDISFFLTKAWARFYSLSPSKDKIQAIITIVVNAGFLIWYGEAI